MPVFTPHDQSVVHSGEGGSAPRSSPYHFRCDSCRPTTTTTTTTLWTPSGPPSPPPKTKVTVVGKRRTLQQGTFLVHKPLPPPLPPFRHSPFHPPPNRRTPNPPPPQGEAPLLNSGTRTSGGAHQRTRLAPTTCTAPTPLGRPKHWPGRRCMGHARVPTPWPPTHGLKGLRFMEEEMRMLLLLGPAGGGALTGDDEGPARCCVRGRGVEDRECPPSALTGGGSKIGRISASVGYGWISGPVRNVPSSCGHCPPSVFAACVVCPRAVRTHHSHCPSPTGCTRWGVRRRDVQCRIRRPELSPMAVGRPLPLPCHGDGTLSPGPSQLPQPLTRAGVWPIAQAGPSQFSLCPPPPRARLFTPAPPPLLRVSRSLNPADYGALTFDRSAAPS